MAGPSDKKNAADPRDEYLTVGKLRDFLKGLPADMPVLQHPAKDNTGVLVSSAVMVRGEIWWHNRGQFYYEDTGTHEPHPNDPKVEAVVVW